MCCQPDTEPSFDSLEYATDDSDLEKELVDPEGNIDEQDIQGQPKVKAQSTPERKATEKGKGKLEQPADILSPKDKVFGNPKENHPKLDKDKDKDPKVSKDINVTNVKPEKSKDLKGIKDTKDKDVNTEKDKDLKGIKDTKDKDVKADNDKGIKDTKDINGKAVKDEEPKAGKDTKDIDVKVEKWKDPKIDTGLNGEHTKHPIDVKVTKCMVAESEKDKVTKVTKPTTENGHDSQATEVKSPVEQSMKKSRKKSSNKPGKDRDSGPVHTKQPDTGVSIQHVN